MATELPRKTIDAWRKFLLSKEGQEGLEALNDLMPITAIDPAAHIMTYHAGMVDGYRYSLRMIWEALATHPVKKEDPDATQTLERPAPREQ
jgi:ABC-type Fe3+ transport system substrate-binding protein